MTQLGGCQGSLLRHYDVISILRGHCPQFVRRPVGWGGGGGGGGGRWVGSNPPACPNYHQNNLFITSIYMYIIAREREITLTKLSTCTVAAEGGKGGGGGGGGGAGGL